MTRSANTPETTREPETGFAALEAKVERMQAASAETRSAPADQPEQVHSEFAFENLATQRLRLGTALEATGAIQDAAQLLMRFQANTFASFAPIYDVKSLLAAQMEYSERVMRIWMGAFTLMANAVPTAPR